MICTYLRSSSFNTHTWCEHQFFLKYVLGLDSTANAAAGKGNVVHKVLECLAQKKLAEQQGYNEFLDDLLDLVSVKECEPLPLLDRIFDLTNDQIEHTWTEADRKECLKSLEKTLACSDGYYDPRNRTVVGPEIKFDFLIEQPWGRYEFDLPNGEKLKGNLALKGTLDLVVQSDIPNVLHLIDYKTGRRWDWITNKGIKTQEMLEDDSQLLMYYYAACHLFPDASDIVVTIFWTKDTIDKKVVYPGGPFTMSFSREDLPGIEDMIRHKFEQVVATTMPKRTIDWRCKSFCFFGKNDYAGSDKTYCDYFYDKLKEDGMDKVVEEHADLVNISKYGSGGGRTAK